MSSIQVILGMPDGKQFIGNITDTPQTRRMDVGINVNPRSYPTIMPNITPAFAGVFIEPGGSLPIFGKTPSVTQLPAGCLPWIRHKDETPLAMIDAYWSTLPPVTPGARYRWTYHHEAAPDYPRPTYLTYWDGLVRLHAAHPRRDDIELVQIQSSYALRWRSDTRWQDWIVPGVTFGLDYYPPDFGSGYEPIESGFALARAAADLAGAGWCLSEWSAEPRTTDAVPAKPIDRASYFQHGIEYARNTGCTAIGFWYGSEIRNKKTFDYRPDPATLTVWKKAMQ